MVQQSVMGFDIDLHRHGPFVCMYPVCICLCVVCVCISVCVGRVCLCICAFVTFETDCLSYFLTHHPAAHWACFFFGHPAGTGLRSELPLGLPPFSELIKICFSKKIVDHMGEALQAYRKTKCTYCRRHGDEILIRKPHDRVR